MLSRQWGDTADSELGPQVKVRLEVVGEAGGGMRAVSVAVVRRELWSVEPHSDSAVFICTSISS